MVDWTKQSKSVEIAEKAVSICRGQPSNGKDRHKGNRRHSSLFKQISNIVQEGRHSHRISSADFDVSTLCDVRNASESPPQSPRGSPTPVKARPKSQQGNRYRATSKASSPPNRLVQSSLGRMQTVSTDDALPSRKNLFSPKKNIGIELYVQDEMSDVEAIAWLTRAPSGCLTRETVRSERDKVKRKMNSPQSKSPQRNWADAPQVFKEGTPGSDYQPSSHTYSSTSRARVRSPKESTKKYLVKMETKDISIIDEDPVPEVLAQGKVRRGAVALQAVAAFSPFIKKNALGIDSRWGKVKAQLIDKKKEEKRAEEGVPKMSPNWDGLLTALIPPKPKKSVALTNAKRHACEVVRRFFWGAVGNEQAKTVDEGLKVLQNSSATLDQVDRLWRMWKRLDITRAGQVDSTAFLRVAHSSKGGDVRPAERAIRVLLDKKPYCTIDDVIRSIWPCALPPDLELVQKQLDELREGTREAETPAPPLLKAEELEGLIKNFNFLKENRDEEEFLDSAELDVLGIRELIAAGFLHQDDAERYFKKYGKSVNDPINCEDFCEMFCPDGFRATASSRIATDEDGNRLALSNGVWRSISEI